MKGYDLTEGLYADFRVMGTAGHEVFIRHIDTGQVFTVVGTDREHHEDGDGSVTHWIVVEDF